MTTTVTINREVLYYIMRECGEGFQFDALNTLLRQEMQDYAKKVADAIALGGMTGTDITLEV